MKNKMMLLAAAAVAALAFAALPALASANPTIDLSGSGHFTASGGAAHLRTASTSVNCTSTTGTGDFTSSTGGNVQFLFHGCTESVFGTACTTSGQPSGTIQTESQPFELVTAKGSGDPATLITPAANGRFASFSCFGGFINIVVTGNGVIGAITAPGYNESSPTFTLDLNAIGAAQEITEIEGSATKFGLLSSTNGGAAEAASEEAEGVGTFAEGGEGELTE